MDPSGGSSSDSAPDCWDQVDMEALGSAPSGDGLCSAVVEARSKHLSTAFSSQLNINAKPFVPHANSAQFVPSFLPGWAQLSAPPAGNYSSDETWTGAGDPQAMTQEGKKGKLLPG